MNIRGHRPAIQAKCSQQTRRLADIPFHRVQAVAAVRNVGRPDIFAGRQQIPALFRNQAPQRDLERNALDVDVIPSRRAWMEIDMIEADADGVLERRGQLRARAIGVDVLLLDRKTGADSPRFPNIRLLGQSVVRPAHVRP